MAGSIFPSDSISLLIPSLTVQRVPGAGTRRRATLRVVDVLRTGLERALHSRLCDCRGVELADCGPLSDVMEAEQAANGGSERRAAMFGESATDARNASAKLDEGK